ncbi:DUF5677 domain-containing protein [Glaciibacter sp. 2TAF33]|uniref:DUF5677 domain-containing protein n=1 Tax=Glaciibacter sp. 2TAF33 TaxID=3233015 RepID=UPI003F911C04
MADTGIDEASQLEWLFRAERLLETLVPPTDPDALGRFNVLYGVGVQAIRASAAYGVLHAAGRGRAGNPVARAALEASVTMLWAVTDGSRIKRLLNTALDTGRSYFERMANWLASPEVWRSLEEHAKELEKDGKGVPSFNFIRAEIAEIDESYNGAYIALSQFTHVSGATIASAIDGQTSELLADPDDRYREATLHTAAVAALIALQVLAGLQDRDTLRDELNRAETLLQMT